MATIIIEHSDSARSGRLGEILRDYGHRLEVLRVHAGDAVPGDLDDIDAIVTCGGNCSPVDDGQEWMAAELELLRNAHASQLPVVGICLGNQLLARALGGEVAEHGDGYELGWHDVTLSPVGREDPVFAGIPWRSSQLHWHRFHVQTPPEGAKVLASSAHTKVQAWSLGLRTYGLQYHPEAMPDTAGRWADEDPEALAAASLTREKLDAETEARYPAFARLAQRLFESMALFLMPVDRRYAGVARDLHH
jgi:GMP synthase-like glutamine amidotransferase